MLDAQKDAENFCKQNKARFTIDKEPRPTMKRTRMQSEKEIAFVTPTSDWQSNPQSPTKTLSLCKQESSKLEKKFSNFFSIFGIQNYVELLFHSCLLFVKFGQEVTPLRLVLDLHCLQTVIQSKSLIDILFYNGPSSERSIFKGNQFFHIVSE